MFKIYLSEGIKNINKNKMINCLAIILFTFLFVLQSYTYSYSIINENQKKLVEQGTVQNYQIYSVNGLIIQMLEMFEPGLFDGVDVEKEVAEFYEEIVNSKYVQHCYISYSGIIIENFKGDYNTFLYDEYFDDDDNLFYTPALYTSENFHKLETYRVIKGRDFTDEDMVFVEGKPRPVLLGYKYLDVYEVGDILDRYCEGDYNEAYVVPQVEVIGFLAEDTTVIDESGTHIYDLDDCIIYPKYYIPIEEWENYGDKVIENAYNADAIRLFINTKFFIDSQHEAEGVEELQEALNNFPVLSKYHKIRNSKQAVEKLQARTEALTEFSFGITAVLTVFAITTVIFFVINRIENNLKDYTIHSMIGASSNNIMGFVISEMFITLTPSIILGLIASKVLSTIIYLPYYLLNLTVIFVLTTLLIVILSAITASIILKKADIQKSTK